MPFMPIILITARTDVKDIVSGLDAGADDYLTKPVDHSALLARVRSMLRIKSLHDTVEAQREELGLLNSSLERGWRSRLPNSSAWSACVGSWHRSLRR